MCYLIVRKKVCKDKEKRQNTDYFLHYGATLTSKDIRCPDLLPFEPKNI